MVTAFIYGIILMMWGAYFLPRWISEHDTQSGRAIRRYKSAMKVVASTPNTPDKVDPEKKIKILRQRRALLGGLALFLLITTAIVAFGYLPLSTLLIPLTSFFIGIVHVRRQVVAAHVKKRRLRALAIISTAEIKLDPTVRIDLSGRENRVAQTRAQHDHWIPLHDREENSTVTVIPQEDRAWFPVAIPKPTYVTAPKAVRSKRVIDLTASGQWSAEQEQAEALALTTRDDLFDQELMQEAAVEHTRVVNE
jgi:hypothetical protein